MMTMMMRDCWGRVLMVPRSGLFRSGLLRSGGLLAALLLASPLFYSTTYGTVSAQAAGAEDSGAHHAWAQGAAADEAVPTASMGPLTTATAVRTLEPPLIDGRNDELIWQLAPRFSAFRQFVPDVDADPSFRTEFQVAFDRDRLYVYVRAMDPHPDGIMHALTRRDVRGPSDQIGVVIDARNEGRRGFAFYVNPDGVKRDLAIRHDLEEDVSWDGEWDVETVVDSNGWAAEFSIPLAQLRYKDALRHTFGFSIQRDIERFEERVAWPEYSPTQRGLASQLGQLEGLSKLGSAR